MYASANTNKHTENLKEYKTRQLYFTRVAQSAARLVSLGALGTR